jgi:hypothetical protein
MVVTPTLPRSIARTRLSLHATFTWLKVNRPSVFLMEPILDSWNQGHWLICAFSDESVEIFVAELGEPSFLLDFHRYLIKRKRFSVS